MAESVELSPVRCAELVAPAISRTFVAGMRAGGEEGRQLVASYGGRAIGYVIDLRNPLAAGRALIPADLESVYRYTDPAEVRATVARSVEHGLLDQAADGSIAASERGRAFLRDLFALHGRVLAERWGGTRYGDAARAERLNAVLGRLIAAAEATAGAAWAAQAQPYEPPGTPPGVLLLNRLSTMRYHRADAHAAAWQAAGLTAAEMVAMPWPGAAARSRPGVEGAQRPSGGSATGREQAGGPRERSERQNYGSEWSRQRQKVEDDTNRRAAPPYEILTPDERLVFLADLATLP
jgi:hypothetical protein